MPLHTSLLPCWFHAVPVRVKTHAAPMLRASPGPPMSAVLPSPESATDVPWADAPIAPKPVSFEPCCVHALPDFVNTQTAPTFPLSLWPATSTVLPSEDTATQLPCAADPAAPVPTSFEPCCVHT